MTPEDAKAYGDRLARDVADGRMTTEQALAQVIATAIKTATDPLRALIREQERALGTWRGIANDLRTALDARVDALERRSAVTYAGVWSVDRSYAVGELVTHDGSLWHANHASTGVRPGDGSDSWTLAVKRGRDAR